MSETFHGQKWLELRDYDPSRKLSDGYKRTSLYIGLMTITCYDSKWTIAQLVSTRFWPHSLCLTTAAPPESHSSNVFLPVHGKMDNSQYGQQSLDGNLFALISDWNPSNLFEIRDVVFVIYNSLLFFIFIIYIYTAYIYMHVTYIYIYLDCHIYIYTCILFYLYSYF